MRATSTTPGPSTQPAFETSPRVLDEDGRPIKVGGQALPDGVVMRTSKAWAVARADGTVDSGLLPPARAGRIPVLRVLAGVLVGLRIGFGKSRRAGRRTSLTPALLGGIVLTEAAVVALDWSASRLHTPHALTPLVAGAICIVALMVFRVVTPEAQWRYHGAEHKAVAAHEAGCDLGDVDAVLAYPRVHPRCGTNLVLWVAMLAPFAQRLPFPAQLLAFPLLLGAIAEVVSFAARHPHWLVSRLIVAPGRGIQAGITTMEPTAAQQEIGCRALVACLERHAAA